MIHATLLALNPNDLPAEPPSLGKGVPSNAEILDAAKSAYAHQQASVDAATLALVNVVNSGSLAQVMTDLDGTNWESGGITDQVVEPIFASTDVQKAIAAITAPLQSFSVGVFSNDLPDRDVGMIGFARPLPGGDSVGITLKIDLYRNLVSTTPGRNLQLGQWHKSPKDIHDQVYGLYISTAVQGVAVNLKILLDLNLKPYGFVESTGAVLNLPVKTSPFGGSAGNW